MELNENQKAAIECIDHNLRIVACAGSGKTEVITRRIANILINKKDVLPEDIVAFTFTRKAAENLKQRIQRNVAETGHNIDVSKMYVGTIHSFCWMILEQYVPFFRDFRILDTVKEHLFIMKYFKKSGAEDLELKKREAALLSNCIEKMVSAYDRIDEWPGQDDKVFKQYKALLYEKRFINYSLLIHEVLMHMDDPQIKKYFTGIRYLVVDEYQDVDDLQEALIKGIANCGANLCVVGDDDQTIYQFRGSNADNMIRFADRYENVKTINLETNYRSGKAIVDVADCVISNNATRLTKRMISGGGFTGSVQGECFVGVDEEYRNLAQNIKSLSSEVKYGDMAILIRKRSRLPELIRALELNHIPYIAEESEEFFSSEYYRKFCNIFEYLENPADENRQKIIDDWKGIVEPRSLKTAIKYLSRSSEKNERFVELFHQFIENLGLDDTHSCIKYTQGFSEILSDFDQVYEHDSWTVRTSDINTFIQITAETEYKREALLKKDHDDAVQIMTVHKSKGLEFDAVFLPDLQKGFFPSQKVGGKKYYSVLGGLFEEQKEKYESDLQDERKLFYVALTRAKKFIYAYADVEKKEASLFLTEMNQSDYCNIMFV
uniref:DNA 3'-5' helicase n=1 Tax=Eubacterium cellulosolvens (strain ATCC 43171 / JCM 9499 / 6) TaxID=633697 RepID=I5AX19_EUBC6